MFQEYSQTLSLSMLSDDMLLYICQYLQINDSQIFSQVSKVSREICTSEAMWEMFCHIHWQTKISKYHLTSERRHELKKLYADSTWHEIYDLVEDEGSRQFFMNEEELSKLTFDYRYRCEPDKSMSLRFKFNSDHHVSGHPNHLTYEWKLTDRGKTVKLGLFPPARVRRLKVIEQQHNQQNSRLSSSHT
jgi:hypothetical protein